VAVYLRQQVAGGAAPLARARRAKACGAAAAGGVAVAEGEKERGEEGRQPQARRRGCAL